MPILRERGGTAIVEFAILLPVILSMLVGLLSFGMYFGAAHSVQQLAADAARRSVAATNDTGRREIVTAYIADNAHGYFLIQPDRLTESSVSAEASGQIRVRIGYDASWLPVFAFARLVPLPPSTIQRDCVILVGGL
ncbi:MAG: pilus assembly protein [Alphaproteobacteria bacterium HGW-Alphaproteobacteria-16]|nr:MAG: pilus assembly protein [Alphaproteobacteria bacterium HGW-Alphaproteobacteria-16]